VPIHARRAALPQDFHGLLGALGVGLDQDKFAIVIERHGVGVDHVCGHVIIGEVGLKGRDDGMLGMLARLRAPLGFDTAAPCHQWAIARRKDRRTAATWLSSHDSFVVNSVLKSRTS
jgi:hypothetical protein